MESAYIGYGSNGKPYDVALDIEEKLENVIRFVAAALDYTLQDVYSMNIVEFFRDFVRAQEVTRKQKQMAEKWQRT